MASLLSSTRYCSLFGQGSFGHGGEGDQQVFADPRAGITYGFIRRRAPFPP
jgi:hypothetical protein